MKHSNLQSLISFILPLFIFSFMVYLIGCQEKIQNPILEPTNKKATQIMTTDETSENCYNDGEDELPEECVYTGNCTKVHLCLETDSECDEPSTGTPGIVSVIGYTCNNEYFECIYDVTFIKKGYPLGNKFPYGTYDFCMHFWDQSGDWEGCKTMTVGVSSTYGDICLLFTGRK